MCSYRCEVCGKPPRGFGWTNPKHHRFRLEGTHAKKRFCSKACQDIHFDLLQRGKDMTEVIRTGLEQQAAESVLPQLGDYVAGVGMDKGLGAYTKAEIQGLVDTVLEAYHLQLQTLYKDEVPF